MELSAASTQRPSNIINYHIRNTTTACQLNQYHEIFPLFLSLVGVIVSIVAIVIVIKEIRDINPSLRGNMTY